MNAEYTKTLDWIYSQLPMYQRIGSAAYKPDLGNITLLCQHLGNPEREIKTVHIAGTNGKGSTSSLLASIFMEAGYRVGLFTSPHLIDFRERITVNGQMIPEQTVTEFINRHRDFFEQESMSFFEMTTGLAFEYFRDEKTDICIIETGLGGRLDSTNIIQPELSIITNIDLDHTAILGNTRAKIAFEKAGIIKPNTPVVLGESDDEIYPVIRRIADQKNAPLKVAKPLEHSFDCPLKGSYQRFNIATTLTAINILKDKWRISDKNIEDGIGNVVKNTGLKGRWQVLQEHPLTICDTGHNPNGIGEISRQLETIDCKQLRMVFGMVSDKDFLSVLKLLPSKAKYYFCQASIPRALKGDLLTAEAEKLGLKGRFYGSCTDALSAALDDSNPNDCIFIGGSTFVVADILRSTFFK